MSLIARLKDQKLFSKFGIDGVTGIAGHTIAVVGSDAKLVADYIETLCEGEDVELCEKYRVVFKNGTTVTGYGQSEYLKWKKFNVMIVDIDADQELRKTVVCHTINNQEYFIDLGEDISNYIKEVGLYKED